MSLDVLEAIESRRSHRAYQPEKLTQAQLDVLIKAALASPSAVNRQPWHFTVVQDQDLLSRLNDAVAEDMMSKAEKDRSPRFVDPAYHVFYHAPAVIFISGEKDFYWSRVDCGIAVENIALAAEGLGLGSVILGMPRGAFNTARADEFRQALCFPEGYDFVIAIAVGVPADTKAAHEIKPDRVSFVG